MEWGDEGIQIVARVRRSIHQVVYSLGSLANSRSRSASKASPKRGNVFRRNKLAVLAEYVDAKQLYIVLVAPGRQKLEGDHFALGNVGTLLLPDVATAVFNVSRPGSPSWEYRPGNGASSGGSDHGIFPAGSPPGTTTDALPDDSGPTSSLLTCAADPRTSAKGSSLTDGVATLASAARLAD